MPTTINGQIVITDRCRRVLVAWLNNQIMNGPSGGSGSQLNLPVGLLYFKLGDAGVSPPSPTMLDLNHSVFQKNLDSVVYELYGSRHSIKFSGNVNADEAVGFGLNEIGIFDFQNNLICYGTYDTINKTSGMVLQFNMRIVI